MPQYERIVVFPPTWINLLFIVNISCRTLVKLWKDVDNKSFGSFFNELGVSGSYPWVMQGFSTVFPPPFPQYFYFLTRFIFQLASCLSFVLDVGRYVFRLTTKPSVQPSNKIGSESNDQSGFNNYKKLLLSRMRVRAHPAFLHFLLSQPSQISV